jgi:hypothetical protein
VSGGGTGRVGPGRAVLGAAGVLLTAYGAWLLLSRQDLDRNLDVALWLAGGVVVHDLVLGSAVIAVSLLATRLLPAVARPAAGAGLVVLGSLTVLAVPFLGAFGRDNAPDNPTLLDRDYTAGYLVLVATVMMLVVLPVLLHTLRSRRAAPEGTGDR